MASIKQGCDLKRIAKAEDVERPAMAGSGVFSFTFSLTFYIFFSPRQQAIP